MMWKVLREAFFLATAVLLSGCTTPYAVPRATSNNSLEVRFPGVIQQMEASGEKVVDVILIHGMCSHDKTWATDAIRQLGATLGASLDVKVDEQTADGTEVKLYTSSIRIKGGSMRVRALVWSPVVAGLKSQLCYDQTDKSELCKNLEFDGRDYEYPYTRAKVNSLVKDRLLNDCLADAIIYQGQSRDAISKQIQRAFIQAASGATSSFSQQERLEAAARESAPLVLIAESLGSKMTFDALLALVESEYLLEREAGIATFSRTALIFMAANQIPILALADQAITKDSMLEKGPNWRTSPDPIAELIAQTRWQKHLRSSSLSVVAFTDPNDVLSYALVKPQEKAGYRKIDVIVSNASTFASLFENPMAAHTRYLENENVMRMIVCGWPIELCGETR